MGGILSESKLVRWFNAATPFWFAALLALVNVILIFICLAETFKLKKDKIIIWSQSVKNIIKAFKIRELRILFITVFLFQSGFTFFTTFIYKNFLLDHSSINMICDGIIYLKPVMHLPKRMNL